MHQRKLIIILALIVLLPLMLLGRQGWKISQDDKQLNDARFNSLVSARLNQVDTVVQSYFEEMQLKWSLLIPQWKLDSEATRKRINNNGNIRQIFVIDPQKTRQFPPINKAITTAERSFVKRLEAIWRDPQMLFSNQSNIQSSEQVGSINFNASKQITKQATKKSKIASKTNRSYSDSIASSAKELSKPVTFNKTNSPNSNKQGWYMWHWGSDANLIYWQQNKDNSIVGIEMEPIRVKADLISRLPDTVPSKLKSKLMDNSSNDFRVRLVDTAGRVVYQWGNYNLIGSTESPQQKRPLSYPLSSWSLEYYGTNFNQSGLSKYSLILTFAGFALLIFGLAWFLYREQTREMRLAKQQVQFVSQVSHELKTPLTNIRMYAEMLEEQIEDAEQPKRYLQVITDESKRLTRLIANVLNFSRAPRIHKRDVEPDTVIQQSIEHFKPMFETKGIALNVQLNAKEKINTDSDILEQILNNLLSNVEKYAANGKRVDIQSGIETIKDKDQNFFLRVRDYGNGISRSERKRIFQAFYRVNDKITEGVSGTGIGLTIARQQAEYLGGTLEFVDVKSGSGACFELVLPLKSKKVQKLGGV